MKIDKSNIRAYSLASPRELVFKYIRYLPLVVLSVTIAMVLAFLRLRYLPVVYKVTGKVLVSNESPYKNSTEKFDDIFMLQGGSNVRINDEIEIIKSTPLAKRVITALGLQVEVVNLGKIRSTVIHPADLPFAIHFHRIADSSKKTGIKLDIQKDHFLVNSDVKRFSYGEIVRLPGMDFSLSLNGNPMAGFATTQFTLQWVPIEDLAPQYSKNLNVVQANDFSNVLTLSYETQNIKMGEDIVDRYILEYQMASLEDKRQTASSTLSFIDFQLDTVKRELSGVERELQMYREKNKMFEPEIQSQMAFSQITDNEKELMAFELRSKVLDYLIEYLSDDKNAFKTVSTTLGIEEPSLVQQVTEFNRLQQEREVNLRTIPAENPIITSLTIQIAKLKRDMIENLKNIRQTYTFSIAEFKKKNKESGQLIGDIPAQQKQLLEVTRQQTILQELYQFLLQKKLETSIGSASTISNIKVVEPAVGDTNPVSPNRRAYYLIAIVAGLGLPGVYVLLSEYLNDRIRSRSEVEQLTDTPILGEVGHAEGEGALVVTKTSRKFLAEQFRIIRSNLQYILPKVPKPVIMVTSSFSGEGKSFISTNLGAVLALSGKKTVILEFDIRKPKILKGLGMEERMGLTNYIVSNMEVDEIVHPIKNVDNLYVVACGPVPPNPSEMLLDERVAELFRVLRSKFDAVIIDTAPVGLVSDGITLGAHADAAVYIVRHNYTLKKQLQLVNDLYEHKKLPQLSLVINDIKPGAATGGYYGYGGYGYGLGYGYGYGFGYYSDHGSSGYFENETKRKKKSKWWSRIRSGKK